MAIKLPKIDKSTFSFRLYNPLMDKVYLYCQNANISIGDYMNNLINEDMKGRVLERKENSDYDIFLLLPLDQNEKKIFIETKKNICIQTLMGSDRLNNQIMKYTITNTDTENAVLIRTHPNNFLDLFIDGTYKSKNSNDANNYHDGLINFIFKDFEYNIFIEFKNGSYAARLIHNNEVVERLGDAGYHEYLNDILSDLNKDITIDVLKFNKPLKPVNTDEIIENYTKKINSVDQLYEDYNNLKSENQKLKKEVNDIKDALIKNNIDIINKSRKD